MPPVACPKCSVVVYETASGGWRFDPPTGCVDRIGSNGPNLCCSVLKPSAYGPSTHVPSDDLRMSHAPLALRAGSARFLSFAPSRRPAPRGLSRKGEILCKAPKRLDCPSAARGVHRAGPPNWGVAVLAIGTPFRT